MHSISDGVCGAGVEAAHAAEAVGGHGFAVHPILCRLVGAGPAARTASGAGVVVDADADDARLLEEPGDEPEGAEQAAVGAVREQAERAGGDNSDDDRQVVEVDIEQVETVHIMVDDSALFPADYGEQEEEHQDEDGRPDPVGEPEGEFMLLDFPEKGDAVEQLLQGGYQGLMNG